MSLIADVAGWLKDNDALVKGLAAIAAPGGIWFWVDKFRNRIRIKVRSVALPRGDTSLRGLTIEVENISGVLTSAEPKITLVGYTPERQRQAYTFRIEGADRQLPPHVSKQLLAWHGDKENRILLFLWYMTLRIPLTRGRCIRVYLRNVEFKQLGFFRFHWERGLYILFGKVP